MAKVKLLDPSDPRRKLDRYELIGEIATGGMATVFLARRGGVGGFQRFVAIKRLHPHLANEPEFVEMFLDEARLAALIHHPNVVPILEVGETEAGYYLVMEYVEGDTLSRIVARTMSLGQMPPRHIVVRMILDALAGLHAAHELRDDRGQLLGLVHRDCSPQNVLVGVDGSARITDFGVARASSRLTSTAHGKLKGKLAYMAPEQTRGDELDRRTDLFAMGIILWEVLCGKRLFKADSEAATLQRILVENIRPPSEVNTTIPKCFDTVVLRALDRNADKRYQNGADLADAIEDAAREAAKISVSDVGVASPREVASFVQAVLGQEIGAQRESVRAWLAQSDSGQPMVIGGGASGSSRPARRRDSDSNVSLPTAASVDELPSTQIDPAMAAQRARTPIPAHGLGTASEPAVVQALRAGVVPQFEVAADVTMRFALEEAKAEAPPRPEPPPRSEPRSSAPTASAPTSASAASSPASSEPAPSTPARPRPPPPAKQSQRTLIGQGPVRGAPDGFDDLDPAAKVAALMNGEIPRPAETVREGLGAQATPSAPPAYVPPAMDDLEDAVTIARPNSGPPPSAMQPAIKTARGMFAEPLLAEARARLESNGQVFGDKGAPSTVKKTPRMPMPADHTGVSGSKLQLASSAMSARVAHDPGAVEGAAIVDAVPIATGPRPHPRTLVSSTAEVSAGGFTPGSMTLSAEAAMRQDALDPTVVHSVPKRGYGKYIVVVVAFLLVFGTGLMLVRSRQETDSEANKNAKKVEPIPTATAKPNDSEPTPSTTSTSTTSAQGSSSAQDSSSAEPSAAPVTTVVRGGGGKRNGGKPTATATPTTTPATSTPATSTPTARPTATATPTATSTGGGEDLTNPYR